MVRMTIADCENPKIKEKFRSGQEMLDKIINIEENFSQTIRTRAFLEKCSFSTTLSPTAAYQVVKHLMVESAGAALHDAYKWKNCSMWKIFGITPAVKCLHHARALLLPRHATGILRGSDYSMVGQKRVVFGRKSYHATFPGLQ